MTSTYLVWQLVDSAFPSGGFAHSSGLEAAAQHGDVRTVEDVERIARTAVLQAGRGFLPLVSAAHRCPAALPDLDERADLFLNQPVSNRASRAQGAALLATARRVFPSPAIEAMAEVVLKAHHAPVFGALMHALDADLDTACRMFLFQAARSPISAAVRLGVIGMFDGQRAQAAMAASIERTIATCRDLTPDDIVQTAPVLDLYQSTQDRLYSRLFQS